jgi:pyruvate/2-oxoglutarate dehydrogenase complex dihydrolipoamide acyltransferase (E2) component
MRLSALTAITVPDIGDFTHIPVIEILVKAGDRVTKDSPLVVLESDKATLDVPLRRPKCMFK